MRLLRYLPIAILVTFLIQGCSDEPDLKFNLKDRIYFKYGNQGYNSFEKFDSITFSFGRHQADVTVDTARIVVTYLGKKSDHDKQYRVRVVEQGERVKGITTAIEGVHYKALDELQPFKGNRFVDTLKIVLNRDALSSSHHDKEQKCLILKLEESEDFELGVADGLEMKLSVNNYLSEPAWWSAWEHSMMYYHPEKWLILIEFDERFGNAKSIPFNGNAMSQFSASLRAYLKANVVLDKETRERVLMDNLVPQ